MKLGDVPALFRAKRSASGAVELRNREEFALPESVVLRFARTSVVFLDIAARENGLPATRAKTFLDIDFCAVIRIRTGRVIEHDRRLAAREQNLPKGNAIDENLSRARQWATRHNVVRDRLGILNGLVHGRLFCN